MEKFDFLKRPVIHSSLEKQLKIFLNNLLLLKVDDVVSIVIWAYMNWLEQLELDDVDYFAAHSPKLQNDNYESYVLNKHRRLYMLNYYDQILMTSQINRIESIDATEWNEIDESEMRNIVQSITRWLNTLKVDEAFNANLELTLRWADQYSLQLGKRFARMCGRTDINNYTDENVTMFLRWCFHDVLIDADRGTPGNMDPWLDR